MLKHSEALWDIVYRTNLTKATAPEITVGYLIEARWTDDARWLGMAFRKRLAPLERDLVDRHTWPEISDGLEDFMKGLFEKTWSEEPALNGELPLLGSANIAKMFSVHSALSFRPSELVIDLDSPKADVRLYERLKDLQAKLVPSISAPVIQMPKPKPVLSPAAVVASDYTEHCARGEEPRIAA